MKRTNRSYLNNPYLKKEQIKKIPRLQKWLDAVKNFFESILKKHA